jgi:osmotically-inducible protein OsmY
MGKGPKGYQRSDERIREEIADNLMRHPQIDASEIEIEVREGMVTLKGTVDDRQVKYMLEDEVEGVLGVKDVTNQVRVQKESKSSGSHMGEGTQSGMSAGQGGKSQSRQHEKN